MFVLRTSYSTSSCAFLKWMLLWLGYFILLYFQSFSLFTNCQNIEYIKYSNKDVNSFKAQSSCLWNFLIQIFLPCQLSLSLRKNVKKVGKYFIEIKEERSRKSKRPFCALFSCVPLNQRMSSKETFWLSFFEKCKKWKILHGT